MHRTLARQLKKYLPSPNPTKEDWLNFLKSIEETYEHFDNDRKLMGRSLELSSRELIEVNEKIAKEKAKDDIILESIGDALIITDEKGIILSINNSGEDLLDCQKGELAGKSFFESVQEIVDEKGFTVTPEHFPINLALAIGKKISASYVLIKKNKIKLTANISATPYILGGKISGTACIVRDVTKEKEIDRAKGEFVSLASHQLRTPLSTIGWYAEMLLAGDAGELNPEQKDYLEEIYKSNRRMVDLVNALLNVSRIDLGTFILTPEPVDFVETMVSVIKDLGQQIHEKELVIKEDYEKDFPKIQADPKLTRIIFQNILTNAVKYTPNEGRVSVYIGSILGKDIKHGEPEEKYALICVEDTGYGIPKNQKNKIFSKLFRADNVREKETDGTGLGLYLVKSVVEACGGEIWFSSEENKGSTFSVIIPLSGMHEKKGQKKIE
jgi:two-component system, OmpR family, sensor histidine kinase VicK